MRTEIVIALVNNTALLLSLSLVYEISYSFLQKRRLLGEIINGFVIGLAGILIMTMPFHLDNGLFFDTRSILIGVAGLFFGPVSTGITMLITALYRFFIGGSGTLMGISVILCSGIIGLLWRKYLLNKIKMLNLLQFYLFGLTVHITMLICTLLLSADKMIITFNRVDLPVMVIYPIGTVLLCLLLQHQKEQNAAFVQVVEAEERYQSMFENSHAAMLIIDPESGQIIDANPAAAQFYGWSIDTLESMNIDQINTLPLVEIKQKMSQSVNSKNNYFVFQHRRAHEPPADVESHSGPIRFKGQLYLFSIIHDVSRRVASEKALVESETRFRTLVEGAPDAIFIQVNYQFAYVNRAAVELYGASSPEELLGTPVLDRFHPDYVERVRKRIHELNDEKKPALPLEQVHLKMDGTEIDVDVTGVPIEFKGSSGAMVFVRNISERKRLESSKLEIEAQLRQQQKLEAIGTLAGGVAHEINNPINGIMNYAQLILEAMEENSESAGYARDIIHETERISVIVKNLLQFSRQEKQSHSYASVVDIINGTISLINTIINKDQIDLRVDLEENLPEIKCRSQQIQQVLMNLLTNARDALNEKYHDYDPNKIIQVSCRFFVKDDRRWIRLTVEDRGNGIPPEVMEKIYEPFFSTKPKEKGTGLGLSISIGIVKDHHGSISIDTKEGEYTRFHVVLPVDNGWDLNNN